MLKDLGRRLARNYLASPTAPVVTPRSGTDRIEAAIGKFTAIADELAAGVAENESAIADNNENIAYLQRQNQSLHDAAARGRAVEAKLRDLIS